MGLGVNWRRRLRSGLAEPWGRWRQHQVGDPPGSRPALRTASSPRSRPAVLAALLLFFPLGLFWMWRDRLWSSRLRWTVTALVGLFVLAVSLSSPPEAASTTQQSAPSVSVPTAVPTPAAPSSAPSSSAAVSPPAAAARPVATAPLSRPSPAAAPTVPVGPSSPLPAAPVASAPAVTPPAPASSAAVPRVAPTQPAVPVSTAPTPRAALGVPPSNLCGAPPNPYGLNYCGRGAVVVSPPADTCSYFSCIPNFSVGKGYLEECRDAMVSMSGGRPGACSHHDGELRPITR